MAGKGAAFWKRQRSMMVLETGKFEKSISRISATMANVTMPDVLRMVAFELMKAVILRTPVDTGRARGGWTPWLDKQGFSSSSLVRQGSGGGISETEVAVGKNESGFLENFSGKDQFILIVNGVPYILVLEAGYHSAQAPNGMVRISMREMRGQFGLAFRKHKKGRAGRLLG